MRAPFGTLVVGRGSVTWDLMRKTRSGWLLDTLGVVRAEGLIYEGVASGTLHRLTHVRSSVSLLRSGVHVQEGEARPF